MIQIHLLLQLNFKLNSDKFVTLVLRNLDCNITVNVKPKTDVPLNTVICNIHHCTISYPFQ